MNSNNFLILLLILLISSCSEADKATSVNKEDFSWLVGDWRRTNEKADRTSYESWQKINSTQYNGLGFTMKNKDTIWKETITLTKKGNQWNFEVLGDEDKKPTLFKVTSIEKEKFVCENKKHDFPKKIEYTLKGNKIKAMISSDEMEIPFDFERITK